MGIPCTCCCSPYKVLKCIDFFLFLVAIVFIISGISLVATFGPDSFFTKEVYIMMIVFGFATFIVTLLGFSGAQHPKSHPNYLFCYWCVVSILLVGNIALFHFFKVFVGRVEDNSSEGSLDSVLSVIENEVAKQLNDYIMSSYTTCCSGCDPFFEQLDCADIYISGQFTDEIYCSESILSSEVGDFGTLEPGQCIYAEKCTAEQLNQQFEDNQNANGLSLGCYTNNGAIPSYLPENNICAILHRFSVEDLRLVGHASNGFSCGGGRPDEYLENVVSYLSARYIEFTIPWVLMITILFLAWCTSCTILAVPTQGGMEIGYKASA